MMTKCFGMDERESPISDELARALKRNVGLVELSFEKDTPSEDIPEICPLGEEERCPMFFEHKSFYELCSLGPKTYFNCPTYKSLINKGEDSVCVTATPELIRSLGRTDY